MPKLRVEGDGTRINSKVYDEDGNVLDNVIEIRQSGRFTIVEQFAEVTWNDQTLVKAGVTKLPIAYPLDYGNPHFLSGLWTVTNGSYNVFPSWDQKGVTLRVMDGSHKEVSLTLTDEEAFALISRLIPLALTAQQKMRESHD